MMNLFVLWAESYGEALKSANTLASHGGHLLDCSIIGKWSQVLVHFPEVPSDTSFLQVPLKGLHKKTWLPGLKSQIVESYLSLSTQSVGDFLLTIETTFIGDIFDFLQHVDLSQYPIVDLRLLRFNEPKSLLLLSGSSNGADALLVILENLKSQGKVSFQFEMVRPVAEPIKDLFSYSTE